MKKQKYYKVIFLSFLFAIFTQKNFICGVKYFPVLDDYIQYGVYPLFNNVVKDVFINIGTIYTRPLAGVFDVFVWANFWDKMYIPLFIICVLQFLSAVLIMFSFEKIDVHVGKFFLVFYLFCPLNCEGTYWISASSRICVGAFFCALSIFAVSKQHKKINILLFFIFNLISYLFYEQCLIFSFCTAVYFIFFKNRKLLIIPVLNAVITGVYYILFSNKGAFAQRSEFGFKIIPLIKSNIKIFFDVLPKMIIKTEFILWAIPIGILFYLFFRKVSFSKTSNTKRGIVFALLILFLPYLPFLILKNSYVSLRNIVFALGAIGILLDNIKIPQKTSLIIFCLLLSIFSLSSANEVMQYKKVYEIDKTICKNIIKSGLIKDNKNYYLVGAKPLYADISVYFNEHIHNVTQSNWALTGALRAYSKNLNIKNIIPIPDESYEDENFEKIYIDENLNISK